MPVVRLGGLHTQEPRLPHGLLDVHLVVLRATWCGVTGSMPAIYEQVVRLPISHAQPETAPPTTQKAKC